MDKLLNLRVSNEFMEVLEEAKWNLRKPMTEIVREAVIEYLYKHLSKEHFEKVNKMMEKVPEVQTKKGRK